MADRIGFIGVGFMGHGMAKNIVEKGFPLTVLAHRKRDAVEDLKARGAEEAPSARALAEASDIVILCVTGSPQVEALLKGPDGLAAAGRPLVVVDCSTSDPAVTTRLAADLAPSGITIVDAPLSRTPKEAWEGTLDVMVGGEAAVLSRIRPVLDTFAGRVIETGPVGSAHTMKLLNNFLALGYAALYAEALMIGAKADLAPKVFDSVIRGGRMDCLFYQTFFSYVIGRDPNAHKFTLSNALKDVSYLAAFAQSTGAANLVGAAVRNCYALAVNAGEGEAYVPTLADFVAESNATSLV